MRQPGVWKHKPTQTVGCDEGLSSVVPVSYRCAAAFLAGLVESVVSLVDVDGVEQLESAKRLKAFAQADDNSIMPGPF